jgi:tmRNA-binding protein
MSSKSGGAKKRSGSPVIADNRRARFDYEILDTLEVGIQLTGTEVKSLRANKANIAESYVQVKNGELWLINANIPNTRWATASTMSRAAPASCWRTGARLRACSRAPRVTG